MNRNIFALAALAVLVFSLAGNPSYSRDEVWDPTDFSYIADWTDVPFGNIILVADVKGIEEIAYNQGFITGARTIQDAIDMSIPGDTIVVTSGFWAPFEINNGVRDIDLIGIDATLYTEDELATIVTISDTEGIGLYYFNMYHEAPDTCAAGCVYISSSNDITIQGCDISGSGFYGIQLYDSYKIDVLDNWIYNCSDHALSSYGNSYYRPLIRVMDNYFWDNGVLIPDWSDDAFNEDEIRELNYFEAPFD
jgi:parallel beta-helix repeat protein